MIAWQDHFNMLKKMTFKKWINLLRLRFSYRFSKITKKNKHKGLPISLSIEPTTACNLGCPECPSGLKAFTRPTGNLSVDFNKKIIDELADTLLYVNYYFQGEPLIHKQFNELVSYAHQKGIYTATSTNAHFLTPKRCEELVQSGLDRLIISIDGTTQETYEQYRVKGKLEKVIKGTKNIMRAKEKLNSKTPHTIFQFLVVKPNEHQIDEVFKLAKELKVDKVNLKTAQVYNYKNGNPLIPENEKYARYKKQADGTYKIKNKLVDSCWRMWSSAVVTISGGVVPCCFDKDAQHQLGDLKEGDTFKKVWSSKEYQAFRYTVLTNRSQIDICKNCSEGTKVWA